jgi:hypothetical protein
MPKNVEYRWSSYPVRNPVTTLTELTSLPLSVAEFLISNTDTPCITGMNLIEASEPNA